MHIRHLVKMTRDFTLLFYKVLGHVSEKPPKLECGMLAVCDHLVKTAKRYSSTRVSLNRNVGLCALC